MTPVQEQVVPQRQHIHVSVADLMRPVLAGFTTSASSLPVADLEVATIVRNTPDLIWTFRAAADEVRSHTQSSAALTADATDSIMSWLRSDSLDWNAVERARDEAW